MLNLEAEQTCSQVISILYCPTMRTNNDHPHHSGNSAVP